MSDKTNEPLKKCECGRCGKVIPSERWEHGWPLYGTIDLGFPAQAFGALGGMQHCADQHHFNQWQKGHPAMVRNEAQHVTFTWSDSTTWRLCYDCQKELLLVVGWFFGIPQAPLQFRPNTCTPEQGETVPKADFDRLLEDRARFPDRPDDIGRMIQANIDNAKVVSKGHEKAWRDECIKTSVLSRDLEIALLKLSAAEALIEKCEKALAMWMHADGCFCEASFAHSGCHPSHSDECQASMSALSAISEWRKQK